MAIRFQRQALSPNNNNQRSEVRYEIETDVLIDVTPQVFQHQDPEPLQAAFAVFPNVSPLEQRLIQAFDSQLDFIRNIMNIPFGTQMQADLYQPNQRVHTDFIRGLSARDILDAVEGAMQSYESFEISGAQFYVRWIMDRPGIGAYLQRYGDCDSFVASKRCIFKITTRGDKNDCFFQALAMGLAYGTDQWKSICKPRQQAAREKAAASLREQFGLAYGESPTIGQFPLIEAHFDVSLWIESHWPSGNYYTGAPRGLQIFMYLDSVANHVHFIEPTKVAALFAHRGGICQTCGQSYNDTSHACIPKCRGCLSINCAGTGAAREDLTIHCDECNRLFADPSCLANHLTKGSKGGKSVCERLHLCSECTVTYYPCEAEHVCGQRTCVNCNTAFDSTDTHQCYIQTLEEDTLKDVGQHYVFFDIESTLDDGNHNLAMLCCLYNEESHTFLTMKAFITWLRKTFAGCKVTCISHNGSKYDVHFVKAYLMQERIATNDVKSGNKLNSVVIPMKKGEIRFIDSIRFIAGSLASFTKTFGLKDLTKGFFPYTFFTKETLHYKGVMPEIHHFKPEGMKPKARVTFEAWYEKHKHDEIDLFEMCKEYCLNDCRLLKQGCEIFRKDIMNITNEKIDPFQLLTIASVAHTVYRYMYMPNNTIALLQSRPAESLWLAFLEEYVEQGYQEVDDQCVVKGNQLCIFRSCYNSGCPRHQNANSYHRGASTLFKTLWLDLKDLSDSYQRQGFQVKIVLDCTRDPKDTRPLQHLRRSEAFYGGRVEVFKRFRKARKGEAISYYDVTSLYPTIQSGSRRGYTADTADEKVEFPFPIGHPTFITDDFKDIDEYFGFCKCRVYCPTSVYIPLLPYRKYVDKNTYKLVFATGTLVGTWSIPELIKAREIGYQIIEIYEIEHYESTSTGLFKDYVNAFMTMKLQAGGWKKLGSTGVSDRDAILAEFEAVQGTKLDASRIDDYNAGAYSISKLFLNSLWGVRYPLIFFYVLTLFIEIRPERYLRTVDRHLHL
jgi:hypothetical protein